MYENIEDSIFEASLPVNSIAVLNRIKQVLEENKTNSLRLCKHDKRIDKLMWLLMEHYLDNQLGSFNMTDWWEQLNHKHKTGE